MQRRLVRLVLLLVVASGFAAGHRAGAVSTMAVGIGRDLDPVILSSDQLPSFIGTPVHHLLVYVYRSGTWTRVPAQVDEVDSTGKLVASDNGSFDAQDQLVFMKKDLGEQTEAPGPNVDGLIVGGLRYQVEVLDPLDPASKAYAYIVRASSAPPSLPPSYVSWDAANHRIIGESYQLGYGLGPSKPNIWFDYLTLGTGADILHRMPHVYGCGIVPGATDPICLAEDDLIGTGLQLVKTGPIRVIVRGGSQFFENELLGYGGMVSGAAEIFIPTVITAARLTTNFNVQSVGAKFYNANTPGGVTIDGSPDLVSAAPLSPWWQVSTPQGTIVNVADPSDAGGTQTNYYGDDADFSDNPAGLRFPQYGNTGIGVIAPRNRFVYRFSNYVLPGLQPNVGSTYAQYLAQPLKVTGTPQQWGDQVFLPLVAR